MELLELHKNEFYRCYRYRQKIIKVGWSTHLGSRKLLYFDLWLFL